MKALALFLAAVLAGFALHGNPAMDRLNESVQELNDSIQDTQVTHLLPELAKLLKTETVVIEKAMVYDNRKLSDVALAHFVAEKSGQAMDSFLKNSTEWPELLQEKKININEAREYLDNLASEVAFVVFEHKNSDTDAKKQR